MSAKNNSLEIVEPTKAVNLTTLAGDINATHAAAKSHAQLAVVFALRTGELCNTAKDAIQHKLFGAWLAENCPGISERTAQRYMALTVAAKAESAALLAAGTKNDTVSFLPFGDLTAPGFLKQIEKDEAYREQICAQVREVVGEGSLTDLYKDYGVIHGPRNENDDGTRKHYAAQPKKLSPEEVAKANRAAAKARLIRALVELKAALDDKQTKRWLQPKDWTDIRKLARDRAKQLDAIADRAEAAALKLKGGK